MNRNEEYRELLNELEQTPPELAFTMTRVKARGKKHRVYRSLRAVAASLGGVMTAFVLLVNYSLPFALACVNMPLMRELMEAVAFSESLKTMIEHDFVQPVNQTKAADGAEMTIHYLVYDGTEMNLFYTASYNGSTDVELHPDYTHADGSDLGSLSWSTGLPSGKGTLNHMSVGIHSGEAFPSEIRMTVEVYPTADYYFPEKVPMPAPEQGDEWMNPDEEDRDEEPVAVLVFDLALDERFITAKRIYTPRAKVDLNGRILVVEEVVVYPTGTRMMIREDENNDAVVSSLKMWLEDGEGNRIKQGSSGGIISSGDHYWMNSVYFEPDDDLTLCIAEVQWREKEKQRVTLDLVDYKNSQLPEGITLTEVERNGADIRLVFRNEVTGGNFASGWYDENGELQYFNRWGSRGLNEEDFNSPPFENITYIWDYNGGDTVDINLHWNEITKYEPPVRVPLI